MIETLDGQPQAAMPSAGPRRRRRIDWARAAGLIAAGHGPEAVAAILDMSEERFWRHFRKSERFRGLIRQAAARRRGGTRWRLKWPLRLMRLSRNKAS